MDAETLDRIIIKKVHDALGFPFQPSAAIATLPLALHGFGFPSIARINAGLAIEGIARDLNHHISAYRQMARITLSDWMCERNNCIYPLDGIGLQRDFSRHTRSIPSAWITAHKAMKEMSLSLRQTDQSHIANGDVSFSHLIRRYGLVNPQVISKVNGTTLHSLRLRGVQYLRDVGNWSWDTEGNIFANVTQPTYDKSWSLAACQNWTKLAEALHQQIRLDDMISGPIDLAIPKEIRQDLAERLIESLGNVLDFEPSKRTDGKMWASDGSMIPASASLSDNKSVIGAATGARTLAMKIPGRNISILHGEQMGLIIALVLSGKSDKHESIRLFTDHLNSVRLINDSQTNISQVPRLRYMNGRSYYRWILSFMSRSNVDVAYTPGHSNVDSIEPKMNNEADFFASSSQKIVKNLPALPIPSFFMNDYTFFSKSDGWIESNIPYYIDTNMAIQKASSFAIGHGQRMSTWVHDKRSPPDYPYLKAVSAYSATVQLYARSGQLATADILKKRGKLNDDRCRLGCDRIETMRHLFVHCQQYEDWHRNAGKEVVEKTELKLTTMKIEGVVRDNLLNTAKFLFTDNPSVWPLHHTLFYLGQIPDLDPLIPAETGISEMEAKRLKYHLSSDWHTSSVRLAGRIFGDFQRRMAVLNKCPLNKP